MSYWRHRRDNNERPLVKLLEALGAVWLQGPPLDGWVWYRGVWTLCEVKDPKKEGWKDEYTPKQQRLFKKFSDKGVPHKVLRNEDDVYRLLGAVRAAG